MSVCDVCNVKLKKDSKRFSSAEVKKAVKAGFRQPSSGISSVIDDIAVREFGPEAKNFMEAQWIKQVMNDNSDWLLCPRCAEELEKKAKGRTKTIIRDVMGVVLSLIALALFILLIRWLSQFVSND